MANGSRAVSRILRRSRNIAGLQRAIANKRSNFSVDYSTLFTGTPSGGGGSSPYVLADGTWNDNGMWIDAEPWKDAA